jgi:hypothetical protein
MEGKLTMSNRDIDKLKVIHNILNGHLTWNQAGQQLDLGRRQIGYLVARVRAEGHRGIIHRLCGKPSNHQVDWGVLEQALSVLHDSRYNGFGPTLANEKLEELYGLKLSTSALRNVMLQTELWTSRTYAFKHRAWRERRSCVGELTQLDGSDHDWFEGRGPRCWLIAYIDDATSRLLYAEFADAEDTVTLMRTSQAYFGVHGRPGAFYVDKDSIYKTSRHPTIEEELRDLHPITQFTRAMGELGIAVICAESPQAKGRVERSFGTHQDRLVKELRLAGISSKEKANAFLWSTYIPAHNAKFAVPPANTTDAHRPLLQTHSLEEILSVRTERTLGHDYTLRFQNQFFQVLPDQPVRVRPEAKICIERRLDGSIHLRFKNRYLNFKNIDKKPSPPLASPKIVKSHPVKPQVPYKPPVTHPWVRFPACPNPKNWNRNLVRV